MNFKGQGSVEYLIILAVIVVVALVVAGVMGWFPGLSTGITEDLSKNYWSEQEPLAVTDWKLTSTNGQFSLQNKSSNKITLNDVSVDGVALGLADHNIAAGSNYTTVADTDATCTSGESYSFDVIITYSVVGGIQDNSFVGTKPLVGTCP